MAAVLNVVGALTGTAVATTVGKGIIPPELATQELVAAALIAAIIWNLITWWYGIPSSSSHALVFSIVGAGIAAAGTEAIIFEGVSKVLKGLVYSPLLGFIGAFAIIFGLLWLVARWRPRLVERVFGRAQILSAAFMAFSHGSNDAQKTMGVITLALASYYGWTGTEWHVPLWVILAAATAMGLGTAIGGWRIVRTMGLKVVELRPIDGFAAETAAATRDRGRQPARHPGLHDARHLLGDPRRRRHPPRLRGALGHRRADRQRLGDHHPGLHRASAGWSSRSSTTSRSGCSP